MPEHTDSQSSSTAAARRKTTASAAGTRLSPHCGAYAFLWCAATATVFFFFWKFFPEQNMAFAKHSILGFSFISLLRATLGLAVPFAFFAYRYRYSATEFMGRRIAFHWVIQSVFLGLAVAVVALSGHNLTIWFSIQRGFRLPLPAYLFPLERLHGASSVMLLLTAGILLPILAGEALFRGLLLPTFPTRKTSVNILFGAIVFALYIQSPADALPVFLAGIALGCIRFTSGHILSSILTLLSTAGFMYLFSRFLPFLPYTLFELNSEAGAYPVHTDIIALGAGILLMLMILDQCRRNMRIEREGEPTKPVNEITVTGQIPQWTTIAGLITLLLPWFFM